MVKGLIDGGHEDIAVGTCLAQGLALELDTGSTV